MPSIGCLNVAIIFLPAPSGDAQRDCHRCNAAISPRSDPLGNRRAWIESQIPLYLAIACVNVRPDSTEDYLIG